MTPNLVAIMLLEKKSSFFILDLGLDTLDMVLRPVVEVLATMFAQSRYCCGYEGLVDQNVLCIIRLP